MRLKTGVLAAAFLAVIGGPALAGYGSSAEVRGLAINVVDLDPADGIDARVSFEGSSALFTFLYDNNGEAAGSRYSEIAPLQIGATALATQWASASNYIATTERGYSIASQGMLSSGSQAGAYKSDSFFEVVARMTPHTAVVVTGSYLLSTWATKDPYTERVQRPYANVFWGEWGKGSWESLEGSNRAAAGPSFLSKAGDFSFTMSNFGDVTDWRGGTVSTTVMAGWVAPVPEPSTYAMMAAGLGLVGFAARRRKPLAE